MNIQDDELSEEDKALLRAEIKEEWSVRNDEIALLQDEADQLKRYLDSLRAKVRRLRHENSEDTLATKYEVNRHFVAKAVGRE